MYGGGTGGGRQEIPVVMAAAIRKGPWMAAEDAVLLDYVKKHGPRDWSSIRSKGLLPRTGKSCRLRWVNKLKPGLKTGCKFSAEEERIMIDLQERIGNKWAYIATYLPGRTDNDVKNFWSTRQKRLARVLQAPLTIRSHIKQESAPLFEQSENPSVLLPHDPPCLDLVPWTEECSALPHLQPAITGPNLCFQDSSRPPQAPLFDHSLLDLPLLPAGQDMFSEFDDLAFPNHFAYPESCHAMPLSMAPAFFDGVDGNGVKIKHPETLESFFDDFPSDIFDCLDQPPDGFKGP